MAGATMGRPRRGIAIAGLMITVMALVALLLSLWIPKQAADFYLAGKRTEETLDRLAEALQSPGSAEESQALETVLSEVYRAPALGLLNLGTVRERDGVREHFFPAPSSQRELDRTAAISEWIRYRNGFDAVQKVNFHLDRLERWRGGEIEATVRFELLGKPSGEPRSGVDRALLRMRLEPHERMLVITRARLLEGERLIASRPRFIDVARRSGISFRNRYYPGFLDRRLAFEMIRHGPGGITAADYDGDGWHDLFIPDGVESRLFRNRRDGTFEDVTARAGLGALSGVGVALFADIDNDGDEDLFVSRTFEPNQLFLNRGDGTFIDVTSSSGLEPDCCVTAASFADIDNDGDLDLYECRYLDPRREIPTSFYARNGEPNRLYRNNGGGIFTDITASAGVGDRGLCLGSAFGDYDGDGWPDLWVTNDFGRNTLYRNRGDGTFEDVTARSGTLAYGAGMSANFGDYDNDGRLDLYVAHIRSDQAWYAALPTVLDYGLGELRAGSWREELPLFFQLIRQSGPDLVAVFEQMASGNNLLRNRGDGTFEDVTASTGTNPPGWFWGSVFADFDNDGWLDIYSANGWIKGPRPTAETPDLELEFLHDVVTRPDLYNSGRLFSEGFHRGRSWHGWERNRHLRNNGDGTFTEVGYAEGDALTLNSRGVAVADFWNRGVLDLAIAASDDYPALLANEPTPGHHWLALELHGAASRLARGSNRDAVGARVSLSAGGLTQLREVTLGDGYGSQSSLRLYFGLGRAPEADRITVRWPRSGRTQTFHRVRADRFLRLTEGEDRLVERAFPSVEPLSP